jgi:hypothetical protein
MKVVIEKIIQYLKSVIEDELRLMDAYYNQFA